MWYRVGFHPGARVARHWWHSWRDVEDTGLHAYRVCARCGAREVRRNQRAVGHQPVDRGWLATGRFMDWSKITPTAGTGARR